MMSEVVRILHVEDDEDDHILVSDLLDQISRLSFDVDWVASYDAGVKKIENEAYDLCLLDFHIGQHTGVEFLERSQGELKTPIILLAGLDDIEVDIAASEAGAVDFLSKSELTPCVLDRSIRYALHTGRSIRALKEAQSALSTSKAELEVKVQERTEELLLINKNLQQEITERKSAEERLRKLSRAVEQSPASVLITDTNGTIEYVNPKFEEVTGYSAAEAVGRNPSLLKSGETSAEDYKELWQTILTGCLWQGEFQNKRKNGELFWEQATIGPIKASDGTTTHFLAVKEDITHRKAMEQELIRHRDRLQELVDEATAQIQFKAQELEAALAKEKELNALQRQFVSMASHEFRTPLAIIDSVAQRMLRRGDSMTGDERNERLTKIRKAVSRMTGLIESTLSAARLDAGKIEITPVLCDLRKIVEAVCCRQQEISPSHTIFVDVDGLSSSIYADPKAVDQVFTNLLSNAVKYSPDAKEIEVNGWIDAGMAMVSVRDRGLGIPSDEVCKVFERFFRARTSTGIVGTGIGLNLARHLVELNQGEITVESVEGRGTVFTVRLPLGCSSIGQLAPVRECMPEGRPPAELRSSV